MSDPHAAYSEAEKFIDAEQNDEALEALLKLIDEHPDFTLGHLALARVLTKLGRHLEAVEHSKKACELEPEESFNFTAMSVTCQKAWAGTQDKKFIQMAEDAMAHAHALQGR
ncbi:scaffolding protein [Candidatus Laterigemmans baculatus]|uniref:scaffolding protein n=1 Tax=Candidatus Laterigemmans baculatus TaxID=2770505 RepID=UPI0013D922A4|nr:scaffolding protein [Candidatus Laterigemmans baculatus]